MSEEQVEYIDALYERYKSPNKAMVSCPSCGYRHHITKPQIGELLNFKCGCDYEFKIDSDGNTLEVSHELWYILINGRVYRSAYSNEEDAKKDYEKYSNNPELTGYNKNTHFELVKLVRTNKEK